MRCWVVKCQSRSRTGPTCVKGSRKRFLAPAQSFAKSDVFNGWGSEVHEHTSNAKALSSAIFEMEMVRPAVKILTNFPIADRTGSIAPHLAEIISSSDCAEA